MTDTTEKRPEAILPKINSPEDIKALTNESLRQLADEIRDFIVKTVSVTGGHLASSLGAVEITLSLLKVFSPPEDRIVFDVGHQAYAYKILTGGGTASTLCAPREGLPVSPSAMKTDTTPLTSRGVPTNTISAASGIAQARCLLGRRHKVIAVVGDGSLTCGVSYEGLNQAGDAKKDLIIVLNDNEMSISPNVGAMSRTEPDYDRTAYDPFP